MAVTSAEPDPLVTRFIAGLRRRGVRVPRSVQTQLDEGVAAAGD
jgi:hypothetical protein